jgi:ABC-2 type transport system permease protein
MKAAMVNKRLGYTLQLWQNHPILVALLLHLKAARMYLRNFALKLFIYPIQLGLTLVLWSSITSNASFSSQQVSFSYLIDYFAIVMAINRILAFGSVATKVSEIISSGQLAIYLVRPMHLWWIILAQSLAETLVVLLSTFPFLIILLVQSNLFHLTRLGGFVILLLIGNYLQFWFFFILGCLGFWLEQIKGILYAVGLTMSIVTGAVIPLNLFPDWLKAILDLTPFPYFLYVPTYSLLTPSSTQTWSQILSIVFWMVLLTVGAMAVFRLGLKRFTGQEI